MGYSDSLCRSLLVLLVLNTLIQTSLADGCFGYCWYYNWYLWFGIGWFVIISVGICLGFYRRYRLRQQRIRAGVHPGAIAVVNGYNNNGVGVNTNPNHCSMPMAVVEPQKPPSYDASQFQPYPVAPPPYPGLGSNNTYPPVSNVYPPNDNAYPPVSNVYPPNGYANYPPSYPPPNDASNQSVPNAPPQT